jgi:hypothetical protein
MFIMEARICLVSVGVPETSFHGFIGDKTGAIFNGEDIFIGDTVSFIFKEGVSNEKQTGLIAVIGMNLVVIPKTTEFPITSLSKVILYSITSSYLDLLNPESKALSLIRGTSIFKLFNLKI